MFHYRYCRIIKFIFLKKNNDLIKTEINKIHNQINNIKPMKLFIDKEITINYKFFLINYLQQQI